MSERRESIARSQAGENLDAAGKRDAVRSIEIVGVAERNASVADRLLEEDRVAPRVATRGAFEVGKRVAVGLSDVLSRDSATQTRQLRPGRRG